MSTGLPGPLGIARARRLEREGFVLLPPGYLDDRVLTESRQPVLGSSAGAGGELPVRAVTEVAHHPDLLGLARQVVGAGAVPVSARSHVNAARGGTLVGDWHRNLTWGRPGGPPAAISVVLVLETFEAETGLLGLVPRTHHASRSVVGQVPRQVTSLSASPTTLLSEARSAVGTDLLADLVGAEGVVAPPWSPGAALVYDPRLVHTGVPNLLPFPVRTLAITYAFDEVCREDVAPESWDCPAC